MSRKSFRVGWIFGVVMLVALACTCGPLSQATQGVQTAQAVASQAQGFATSAVSAATQLEQSGVLKTAEAEASQIATSGALSTVVAEATQIVSGDVPDDIPVYPDHQSLVTISGTVGYQAQADLQTVLKFYQTEMVNKGWEQSSEPIVSDSAAILSYKKGDRQATINLGFTGGITAVGIQYTP